MRSPRPGIILQARCASTRLPGKALATIGSRTLLEHCLARLLASNAGEVVLATTELEEDNVLETIAREYGVQVFRGEEHDVLSRYAAAAARLGLDPVIRATGDNPAVDIDAPDRILAALERTGADYVREEGLPIGAAVEGITRAALRACAASATEEYDREHVTTYVRSRSDTFHVETIEAPAALCAPDLRLTVDTPADLHQVRRIFAIAGGDLPSLEQLMAAAATAMREVA